MMASYFVLTVTACFIAAGVFGVTDEEKSVMEGDSVTLNTGVTIKQREEMLWYFNDILIAQINGESSESSLYDGEDGRFRDRLEVDYDTGSLTITNIRSEHAGRYEAENIRIDSSGKRQSLNRNRECDSTNSTHDDTIKTFSVTVSGLAKPKEQKRKTWMDIVQDHLFSSALGAGLGFVGVFSIYYWNYGDFGLAVEIALMLSFGNFFRTLIQTVSEWLDCIDCI